jgi:hypothetical protein
LGNSTAKLTAEIENKMKVIMNLFMYRPKIERDAVI